MFSITQGVGTKVYCAHSVLFHYILLFHVLLPIFLCCLCDWPFGCCIGKLIIKNWIESNDGVVSALTPAISCFCCCAAWSVILLYLCIYVT